MPARWVTYFSHFILRFVEISLCGALSALQYRQARAWCAVHVHIHLRSRRALCRDVFFFFFFITVFFIVGVEKFGVRALEAAVFYRETIAHVPWPSLRCCFFLFRVCVAMSLAGLTFLNLLTAC